MPTTLITGASSGLGAEMARQLADRGWDLALAARRTERLEGLRDEILAAHPGRRVELRALDVTDDAQVFEVFGAFRDDFGTIDRVIVNAGLGKGAPIGTGRYDANRQTAMTNFVAALAQTEAAMEIFRAQKRGHLVMISSVSAMRGMRKTVTTYAATKAGVATLAEGIRNEMLGEPDLDIRVSTIYPGYIRSEMNERVKKTPFIVDTQTGVRAMVEAIEKEKANALVPAWPWVPLGAGDAPPAAAARPEDHVTVARVLVTAHLPGDGPARLAAAGHEVTYRDVASAMPRDELLAAVAGVDALVAMMVDRVDAELLDAAGPGLRVVADVVVGYDNVDVAACTERGVVVTNTPGVLTDATADIAMALVLMTTRGLGAAERRVRTGEPWQWNFTADLGTGLRGKTLGIVGPGAIGLATARRATAFGMEILLSGRSAPDPGVVDGLGARVVDLGELLTASDVVSLHCPLTPATHHLVGAAELRAMKPTAHLVNTARGPVVDEAALVAALEAGEIAGAGLDVFEDEPRVHPGLLGRDDVVLLPHVGSATVETRTAMADLAVANVLAVLAGQDPITPVRG